ncbi:MAG: TerB family tellurite resistance protein [Microcoleaceae cyanobacterium]
MQPPPPPSITPRQMNLLRVVTAMAWADGHLAAEEVDVMLEEFSRLFATGDRQEALRQELREYMMQNIPLEELIPKLQTDEERELVLMLGYEVIKSSARSADEPKINDEEAAAYQKLVNLLDLPDEVVKRVETVVNQQSQGSVGLIVTLKQRLEEFINSDKKQS